MNSFTLHAVGHLAADPELTIKDETSTYARFALLGNDYAGRDREEVTTRIDFVAFGGLAKAIGENAKTGDQLIVEAQVRANNYTDPESGEKRYGYSFVVTGFRFGAPGKAKRAQLAKASGGGGSKKR